MHGQDYVENGNIKYYCMDTMDSSNRMATASTDGTTGSTHYWSR
ncbi:unnamed protein product, partial [Amoebophrya sp. A25]|eukprot:GSA25T00017220001.1